MNKTVFKTFIVLFDLLLCYMLRNFFDASSEVLLFLKSVAWCNIILITFIFWCWGTIKMIYLINKWLDSLYLDLERSFKTEDVIEKMRLQIKEALDNEDYEKAALLKKRLDRKLKR